MTCTRVIFHLIHFLAWWRYDIILELMKLPINSSCFWKNLLVNKIKLCLQIFVSCLCFCKNELKIKVKQIFWQPVTNNLLKIDLLNMFPKKLQSSIVRCAFITYVTVAKSRIEHEKFISIYFANKKSNLLISKFPKSWYIPGAKQVESSILLTFDGAADVSRLFLFVLDQLQHRSFLK